MENHLIAMSITVVSFLIALVVLCKNLGLLTAITTEDWYTFGGFGGLFIIGSFMADYSGRFAAEMD